MTESSRPRILLVTRNLPPLVGGMERLNWHMADELSRFAEVRVIGPEGSALLAPGGVQVVESPLRPLWKFLLRARTLAHRGSRKWKPDVVLAGSGLTAPLALQTAHACGALSAVYVHGLDVVASHPIYRLLWLPALRRMDLMIANSHATAKLAEHAGVDSARIGIVHPGVELPEDQSDPQAIARFRAEYDLGNRPLLLSVGRLSTRKGMREFVSDVLPRIVAVRPDVMLLIVGDAPRDALHARAQTPESIREAAVRVGVADNLRFLGVITDFRRLGVIYRSCQVHVFPVREIPGDPEGFGMVAVEAAAHGLPTVAYATGGVTDAVEELISGHLIRPGDATGFSAAVLQVLDCAPKWESARGFAARFSWNHFGEAVWSQLNNAQGHGRK